MLLPCIVAVKLFLFFELTLVGIWFVWYIFELVLLAFAFFCISKAEFLSEDGILEAIFRSDFYRCEVTGVFDPDYSKLPLFSLWKSVFSLVIFG